MALRNGWCDATHDAGGPQASRFKLCATSLLAVSGIAFQCINHPPPRQVTYGLHLRARPGEGEAAANGEERGQQDAQPPAVPADRDAAKLKWVCLFIVHRLPWLLPVASRRWLRGRDAGTIQGAVGSVAALLPRCRCLD